MIYNNHYDKESCIQPAETRNSASSVTKELTVYQSMKTSTMITDTIGLGDPDLSTALIAHKTQEFLRAADFGVNLIIVVAKFGRVNQGERVNFEFIKTIFEEQWQSQSILVVLIMMGRISQLKK